MITVAILGILAALAIPAFTTYVARAKSAEAAANLNELFKSAAVYYSGDLAGQGIGASVIAYCTVDDAGPEPATPSGSKQRFQPAGDASFAALRFKIADFVYFSYGVSSVGSSCGHSALEPLYTFYANGDLDNDGTLSTFELTAGSDEANLFYHARGLYIDKDSE